MESSTPDPEPSHPQEPPRPSGPIQPKEQPDSPPPHAGEVARILLLNHQRDPLDDLVTGLRAHGFDVAHADSLAASLELLERNPTPEALVVNPLLLTRGGAELELLERVQKPGRPVPVVFLVDDVQRLDAVRGMKLVFRDFLTQPFDAAELARRLEQALIARNRFIELQERASMLQGQVSIDHKTGLLSELYFKRLLSIEWRRAQRHGNPLTVMLLDVDDFKGVNDSTEYAFGDAVLRQVGEILKQNVRETDFAARFGGDEFVILLPQTTPAESVQGATRILQRARSAVVDDGVYSRQITLSIGIDSFDGRSASSVNALLHGANKALQEAKRRGKNQVWLYSGENGGTPARRPGEPEAPDAVADPDAEDSAGGAGSAD